MSAVHRHRQGKNHHLAFFCQLCKGNLLGTGIQPGLFKTKGVYGVAVRRQGVNELCLPPVPARNAEYRLLLYHILAAVSPRCAGGRKPPRGRGSQENAALLFL